MVCGQNISFISSPFPRFSSAAMASEIQVVPDVDKQEIKMKAKAKSSSSSSSSSSLSTSSNQGLEAKLKRLQNTILPRPESPPIFSSATTTQTVQRQPVIRRVSHDARPLTAAEALAHRSLFAT